MPEYPLIDVDPHAGRVIRYFRSSDYAVWAASTIAVPSALLLWEMADKRHVYVRRLEAGPNFKFPAGRVAVGDAASVVVRQMITGMKVGAVIGFCGGFLLAYQRSSKRFWGWTENKREVDMDLAELSQRAQEGKPLYGKSDQPEWVQGVAHKNSVFSQLKFSAFPMFNLVNHPYHGTDPAKYGVKSESASEE